jgi:kynureninase
MQVSLEEWQEELVRSWEEEEMWLMGDGGEVDEVCGRCGGGGCSWCLLLEEGR